MEVLNRKGKDLRHLLYKPVAQLGREGVSLKLMEVEMHEPAFTPTRGPRQFAPTGSYYAEHELMVFPQPARERERERDRQRDGWIDR